MDYKNIGVFSLSYQNVKCIIFDVKYYKELIFCRIKSLQVIIFKNAFLLNVWALSTMILQKIGYTCGDYYYNNMLLRITKNITLQWITIMLKIFFG